MQASTASQKIGFNTQPPEGGWKRLQVSIDRVQVSTHSRPKAAGAIIKYLISLGMVSTHSRPKAAGLNVPSWFLRSRVFQHTAARRRLVNRRRYAIKQGLVSTHSRPKAAGRLFGFKSLLG